MHSIPYYTALLLRLFNVNLHHHSHEAEYIIYSLDALPWLYGTAPLSFSDTGSVCLLPRCHVLITGLRRSYTCRSRTVADREVTAEGCVGEFSHGIQSHTASQLEMRSWRHMYFCLYALLGCCLQANRE